MEITFHNVEMLGLNHDYRRAIFDIFHKLKSIVEVEHMTPDEHLEYEPSLSLERDLYACIISQFEEEEAKGKAEGLRLVATGLDGKTIC